MPILVFLMAFLFLSAGLAAEVPLWGDKKDEQTGKTDEKMENGEEKDKMMKNYLNS